MVEHLLLLRVLTDPGRRAGLSHGGISHAAAAAHHLIHQIDLVAIRLVHRLIDGLHLHIGIQRHHDILRLQSRGLRQFLQRRFSPQLLGKSLGGLLDLPAVLLQCPADLHHTVIPQDAFDFSLEHGHGIGRKPHLIVQIKLVYGFHQPDTSYLEQILHIISTPGETLDDMPHQAQIFLNQCLSCLFISCL